MLSRAGTPQPMSQKAPKAVRFTTVAGKISPGGQCLKKMIQRFFLGASSGENGRKSVGQFCYLEGHGPSYAGEDGDLPGRSFPDTGGGFLPRDQPSQTTEIDVKVVTLVTFDGDAFQNFSAEQRPFQFFPCVGRRMWIPAFRKIGIHGTPPFMRSSSGSPAGKRPGCLSLIYAGKRAVSEWFFRRGAGSW